MAIKPLTETVVKAAKPKKIRYEVNDGDGLALRVSPSGAKSWLFRYTQSNGKRTNYTIGRYPEITLREAREHRTSLRADLAKGIDPKTRAQNDLIKNTTFEDVTLRWLEIKAQKVTPRQHRDIHSSFKNHVFHKLAGTLISDVKAPLVIEILRPIEARGNLETVKRLCGRINEVMDFALSGGLIEFNPLARIYTQFNSPKKVHLASIPPSELPELLTRLYNASISITVRNLILFQLHTMVRPGEASNAKWAEINIEDKLWIIPAERMKKRREHLVPLTNHLTKILEHQRLIAADSEYIFPSQRSRKKPTNSQSANAAIKRMGYQGKLVAHGLRSIASTALNEAEFPYDVIEAQLAHAPENDVRAAYNRATYMTKRREMLEWWSNYIMNKNPS